MGSDLRKARTARRVYRPFARNAVLFSATLDTATYRPRPAEKENDVNARTFATVLGVAFLLAGVAGFFPSPIHSDAPPLTMDHGYGLALGLLPVNTLHNIVHLLFGVLGLAAGRGAIMSARAYAQMVAVAYGLLVVLGLLPATHTTFGLIPIYGNDVWFHAAIAVLAGIVGFGGAADARRSAA